MSINAQLKVAGQSRQPRMICGRVDVSAGTPSVGAGADFTVVDTAPGQVQVVFDHPGKSILFAGATPLQTTDATGHSVKVDAVVEATSATFGVYVADSTDGALVDNVGFYFQVILKDSA